MAKPDYEKEICECCGQSTTYLVGVDRGTVTIVKKIARAIAKKRINMLHLAQEGVLNHNELCNIIRPVYHGLVAHAEGETGNFVLTQKGFDFLNGKEIPKYAIVDKITKSLKDYFEPEEYKVSVNSLNKKDDPYWEGTGFTISQGRVISDELEQQRLI